MKKHRTYSAIAVAACLAFAITQDVQAQRPAGGVGGGAARPTGPTAAAKPAGAGSGEVMRIVKFTPADEAKDPDLIGTLTLKPFKSGLKSVTVRILKQEDAKISIGTASFTPDQYPDILSKGLECAVNWTLENTEKPSSPKNMTSINFQPISVIGVVDKVEGDVITLKKALPSDGRNWLDDEMAHAPSANPPPKPPTSGTNRNPPPQVKPAARKVKPRKIKIRAIEELSKLTDENNDEIAAGDIPPGTKVEVGVILSNATGIITTLAYTNANPIVNKGEPSGPRPGPRPPGGGGGGGGGG